VLLFGGTARTADFWRLGELHLLKDLVGVGPEVSVVDIDPDPADLNFFAGSVYGSE